MIVNETIVFEISVDNINNMNLFKYDTTNVLPIVIGADSLGLVH